MTNTMRIRRRLPKKACDAEENSAPHKYKANMTEIEGILLWRPNTNDKHKFTHMIFNCLSIPEQSGKRALKVDPH